MGERGGWLVAALALLCVQAVGVQGGSTCDFHRCMNCHRDGVTCINCQLGQGFDFRGDCRVCLDPLCEKCQPNDRCWACHEPEEGSAYPVYLDRAQVCQFCKRHPKSSGCTACTRDGECARCADGYRLVNGQCRKCKGGPDCRRCDSDLECTECAPYTGLNEWRQCVMCDASLAHCENCSQNYRTCTACSYYRGEVGELIWYKHAGGEPLCRVCPVDGCLQCRPGGGACDRCLPGWGLIFDNTCRQCQQANCASCDFNIRGCNKCEDGFYWDEIYQMCKKCSNALKNCARCSDADTCLECAGPTWPGMGVVNGKCQYCDDVNCATCNGDTSSCKKCHDNFPFKFDRTTGRCVMSIRGEDDNDSESADDGKQSETGSADTDNDAAVIGAAAAGKPKWRGNRHKPAAGGNKQQTRPGAKPGGNRQQTRPGAKTGGNRQQTRPGAKAGGNRRRPAPGNNRQGGNKAGAGSKPGSKWPAANRGNRWAPAPKNKAATNRTTAGNRNKWANRTPARHNGNNGAGNNGRNKWAPKNKWVPAPKNKWAPAPKNKWAPAPKSRAPKPGTRKPSRLPVKKMGTQPSLPVDKRAPYRELNKKQRETRIARRKQGAVGAGRR